jgi:RNA polymerase sigma-70 factor (ECF subfamily)
MTSNLVYLFTADFDKLSHPLQEIIFKEYYHLVYKLVLFIIKDPATVEDILQEGFLRVLNKAPLIEEEPKMKAWLKIVTKNVAFDYLKKNKKYRNDVDIETVLIEEEFFLDISPSIEGEVENRFLVDIIEACLNQLKPEHKVIIELRWKYEMSYKEIADELSTSEEAIRQRLFRARESIKKKLKNEWGF